MAVAFPYEILEVSPAARPAVIRAAFRCLAQEYHPDRNPGDAEAAARMALLNSAYALLADPLRRARYDQKMGFGAIERRGRGLAVAAAKPVSPEKRPNVRPFVFRPLD